LHTPHTTSTLTVLSDVSVLGAILDAAHTNGFIVAKLRMCCSAPGALASAVPELGESKTDFGDVVAALEIVGEGAVERWQEVAAGSDWGGTVHCCASEAAARAAIGVFFGGDAGGVLATSARLGAGNGTLCLVKPTAVKQGKTGPMIGAIMAQGLVVTAADMFTLDRAAADEFFDVYRGVLSGMEHAEAMKELTSGRMVALEVSGRAGQTQAEVVNTFRDVSLKGEGGWVGERGT